MSKPNRKRHCLESPPPVEDQQQKQAEEDTHSIGAGLNASQCSSLSNCEDSNTINTTASGNGGDDMNELKLKMAALEAKNQILEGKLENQELRGRLDAISEGNILANLKQENRAIWMRLKEVEENARKDARDENNKMKGEFAKMLASLEQKYQQEIAGLKANNEKNQEQQKQIATMQDPETEKLDESHGNLNNSNERLFFPLCPGPEKDRQQPATMASTSATVLTSPPPRNSVAIYPLPCHSAIRKTSMPPSAGRHRKLPPELNCQIFYCINMASRRKFICGLGWDFYAMFRHSLLIKSKRLCNPAENIWSRSIEYVTVSEDGLIASNNTDELPNIYAEKGFPISVADCRSDDFPFPGTICYYYEVQILSARPSCLLGLIYGETYPGVLIGQSPNSYAMCIYDNTYSFSLDLESHRFEFPEGVIRPEWKDSGNVVGCGILMNPDDKLTIFFTFNGILIDRPFSIDPTVDHLFGPDLFPVVRLLWDDSVEANFGDTPTKPFVYDINKCPGMGLEWI